LPSIREMKKAKFKSTCDLKSSALGMWSEKNKTVN
jgi:hypothetical protein